MHTCRKFWISAYYGIPLPPSCSTSTSALAIVTSSMADEDAPPSKLASFFRTLLCSSGSVKCLKDEGSDYHVDTAAELKEGWTRTCGHNHEWTNVVLTKIRTSDDKCPNSSSPASGKTQRQLQRFASAPLHSVNSGLDKPAGAHMSFPFGGTRTFGEEPSCPSFHEKDVHADQEARTLFVGGRHRTPPREQSLQHLPTGNGMHFPARSLRRPIDSMGHAMVEASQVSSNWVASPSRRLRMSLDSAGGRASS
eukprot:gene7686-847_t